MKYPLKTHFELKSREISFAHKLLFSSQIVLKSCKEYVSITVEHSANFQIDLIIELDVLDEWNLARFECKMSFGRISYKCRAAL